MKIAIGALLIVTLCQARDLNWQIGKIVDTEISRETITPGAVTTGTISPDYGGGSTIEANTRLIHREITDTTVTVRGEDYQYVADRQPSAFLKSRTGLISGIILSRDHGCRFIIGDVARYAQDKARIYVKDVDGKTCKLEIVRQARIEH